MATYRVGIWRCPTSTSRPEWVRIEAATPHQAALTAARHVNDLGDLRSYASGMGEFSTSSHVYRVSVMPDDKLGTVVGTGR